MGGSDKLTLSTGPTQIHKKDLGGWLANRSPNFQGIGQEDSGNFGGHKSVVRDVMSDEDSKRDIVPKKAAWVSDDPSQEDERNIV